MLNIVFLDESTLGQVPNLNRLRALGEYTGHAHTLPEAVAERIRDANVIISNKVRLTGENLPAAGHLRLICVAATGMNNVDLDYCRERGIAVRNVVNYSTDSVAQFTWAVLLTLLHRTPELDQYVKSGHYSRQATFSYWAADYWDISGKRLGIIGLGHIGRRVAEIGRAFGAEVVYYSTSGQNDDAEFTRIELDELLRTCDLLSIHAPLNERTRHLIGYDELRQMKQSALLVNTSRGGIVHEAELARALDDGLFAGAAIDVYEQEPLPAEHPYLQLQYPERLLLTPHAAWASVEARTRLVEGIVKHIVQEMG